MLEAGRRSYREQTEAHRGRRSASRQGTRQDEKSTNLEVAVTLLGDVSRDSNGSSSVGDTPREGADVASLVLAGESVLVTLTVDGDVVDYRAKNSGGQCQSQSDAVGYGGSWTDGA